VMIDEFQRQISDGGTHVRSGQHQKTLCVNSVFTTFTGLVNFFNF
jgi:hypothetical protein